MHLVSYFHSYFHPNLCFCSLYFFILLSYYSHSFFYVSFCISFFLIGLICPSFTVSHVLCMHYNVHMECPILNLQASCIIRLLIFNKL
jgi:hypothetical protein